MFPSRNESEKRQIRDPWVQLCTQLPEYVPSGAVRDAVSNVREPIRTVLELCLESRPLFATAVADKIKDFAVQPETQLIVFFDGLRHDLMRIIETKAGASLARGCFGYVSAMLRTGVTLFSKDLCRADLY